MSDLQKIEEQYKKNSDKVLIDLSQKPDELRPEVVALLQKELLSRGLQEEALAITTYFANKKKDPYTGLTYPQLQKLVQEKLDNGDTLENIKLELQDHGINVFDLMEDAGKSDEKAFNYMVDLKQQGLNEEEIHHKLKENLDIGEDEAELLKSGLRSASKKNRIIGYSMLVLGVAGVLLGLTAGGRVTIGSILVIGTGAWLVFKGDEQSKVYRK